MLKMVWNNGQDFTFNVEHCKIVVKSSSGMEVLQHGFYFWANLFLIILPILCHFIEAMNFKVQNKHTYPVKNGTWILSCLVDGSLDENDIESDGNLNIFLANAMEILWESIP